MIRIPCGNAGLRPTIMGAAAALLAACALTACASSRVATSGASGAPQDGASSPIVVVAGENTWGNIAAQIGGDQVRVTSIIANPNDDPHQYESDVNDAVAISRATVVIQNGAGYDDFLARLLAAGPGPHRVVLDVAELVGADGNPNPHFWYSTSYVTKVATAISQTLTGARPANSARFAANLDRFLAGERQVAAAVATIRAKYAGRPIAYTERVPGYLVTDAGLRLSTPASFAQAVEDGEDPSPVDNIDFETVLNRHEAAVLLYNAQVTDSITTHLKDLAIRDGVPVVGVTETIPSGEASFQAWQLSQAQALLAALGG